MMINNDINLYLNYDSSFEKCFDFVCFISYCLIDKKVKINGDLTI